MTPPDLAALRAAAERATPGPWTHQSLEPQTYGHDWVNGPERRNLAFCGDIVGNGRHGYCQIVECEEIRANAAYIALANPATILALLDRVAALEGALRDARIWHEDQAKGLSKQPQTGHVPWDRLQHREQIEAINAALESPAS